MDLEIGFPQIASVYVVPPTEIKCDLVHSSWCWCLCLCLPVVDLTTFNQVLCFKDFEVFGLGLFPFSATSYSTSVHFKREILYYCNIYSTVLSYSCSYFSN